MVRAVTLLLLAGCGRVGFDASEIGTGDAAVDSVPSDSAPSDSPPSDGPPAGHDEDADGVIDELDTCPHLPGAQTDGDGDGVGDLCDPEPTQGGETIALFATMSAEDQPFMLGADDESAFFTQLPDALRLDGTLGADQNLYANLRLPITLANVQVTVGFDILEVVPGALSNQNQIALAVWDQAPNYFVEFNQIPGNFANAAVMLYDGSNYSVADGRNLATGIRTGPAFLQTTQRVGEGVRLDGGWPGEVYEADISDDLYQGAQRIEMNINNVRLELRYVTVITSP